MKIVVEEGVSTVTVYPSRVEVYVRSDGGVALISESPSGKIYTHFSAEQAKNLGNILLIDPEPGIKQGFDCRTELIGRGVDRIPEFAE